jgi:flavin-dependent dehydrogenase
MVQKGLAIEANIYRDARNDDLVFDFAPIASGYGWIFPKRDHVNIGLYCIDPSKHLSRARLSEYIVHRFGDNAKPDNFVGQHLGFGAAQHWAGNHRIFLVGDAGGFVDPLTGEGIYGAVISCQAAASAICANLDRNADASETFIHLTQNLRRNPGTAEHAAASFYVYPDRGIQAMKIPLLRSAILKSYAVGFNLTSLAHVAHRILHGD